MGDTRVSIRVKHGAKEMELECARKDTLLEALSTVHVFHIDASCGGKGTCGKCKVIVSNSNDSNLSKSELKFLSKTEIEKGYRLACQVKVNQEMVVIIDDQEKDAQIEAAHEGFKGSLEPLVKKKYIELPPPSLSDQRDDVTRITDTLGIEELIIPLSLKRTLSKTLRNAGYSVTAVYSCSTLIGVEEGNTETENYGVAVDIGTTTVVAHLLNMYSGKIVDTVSGLNRQKTLGADVISRIEYCIREPEGLKTLSDKIVSQIAEMVTSLVKRNRIREGSLHSIMTAGNTTMMHLLYGTDPEGIAAAPFIPVDLQAASYHSSEIGNFPFDVTFCNLPAISAYVGADITAGILATKMHKKDELSLLIDIGTNGEIVLGNKDKLYCCSTAAGPAFEGAHITCGMGGVFGAIDTISLEDNTIKYTTIGNSKPAGICGSGIIDAVSILLKSGVVDFTGRILEADEIEKPTAKSLVEKHFAEGEGNSFILAPSSVSETGANIVFTQKDIREVQLAKAAISAGVATLLATAGKNTSDIAHVYIAGGFGSYISKESAAAIGLIPAELLDRTESVGNTSGKGAAECSFSRENYLSCNDIIKLTEYVELSSNTYFQGKYMEDMTFPEY